MTLQLVLVVMHPQLANPGLLLSTARTTTHRQVLKLIAVLGHCCRLCAAEIINSSIDDLKVRRRSLAQFLEVSDLTGWGVVLLLQCRQDSSNFLRTDVETAV